MIVRRVGVWSVARVYGALSGAMGLIFGFFLALLSLVGAGMGNDDLPAFAAGALGIGAIIVLPIFYGCLGVIAGAVGALLYNLFAGMVGGIEIQTE